MRKPIKVSLSYRSRIIRSSLMVIFFRILLRNHKLLVAIPLNIEVRDPGLKLICQVESWIGGEELDELMRG